MKYPRAIVDTRVLQNNVAAIKKLSPKSKILAIIKSNAYGHGLTKVAQTLHGHVDGLGVARISEAEELRTAGISGEILLLEGFFTLVELLKAQELNLSIVVHSQYQYDLIHNNAHQLSNLNIWVKYNTGMNRLGLTLEEAKKYLEDFKKLSCVSQVKLMSHLARADDLTQKDYTQTQYDKFYALLDQYDVEGSIAASAGIIHWEQKDGEWIRPGIMVYGISPNEDSLEPLGIKPVLNLETILIAKNFRKKGDYIGYGGTYQVPEDTYIGVVAIGYGDGYPREAPLGTPMYINSRNVSIVGRVSMDMVTVDLGPNSTDHVGDRVVIFGKELPVEVVAKAIGVINWELTTTLTARVGYYYLIK